MAYQAAKRMTLAGVKVKPGDRLDEELLAGFPFGRIDSLRRVGHIIEVPDQVPEPEPKRKSKPKPKPEVETVLEEEAPSIDPVEESIEVSSSPETST